MTRSRTTAPGPSWRSWSRTGRTSSSVRSSSRSRRADSGARDDVQEDPHRQPRRDRHARHPRLPRARHPLGGHPLRGRRQRSARALRRRGGVRGAGRRQQELPPHPAIISAAEITVPRPSIRGTASSPRTRTSPRSARSAGWSSSAHARGMPPGRQVSSRAVAQTSGCRCCRCTAAQGPRRRARGTAERIVYPVIMRPPRRRAARDAHRPQVRGGKRAVRDGIARGHDRLQEPGRLPERFVEDRGTSSPDPRDQHGQSGPSRARLLAAAPPPESHRGVGDPAMDTPSVRVGENHPQGDQGDRVHPPGHAGVPMTRADALTSGDEHPRAGRAPGHRDGPRRRPGGKPDPRRRREKLTLPDTRPWSFRGHATSAVSTPRIRSLAPWAGRSRVPPARGGGVRVDSASTAAGASDANDSLIAKVIAHGRRGSTPSPRCAARWTSSSSLHPHQHPPLHQALLADPTYRGR